MILLLDTSSPECCVFLYTSSGEMLEYKWQSDRALAKGLLGFIESILKENKIRFKDLGGIGFYKGPGSFTGLRIGAATCNAVAYTEKIALVGAVGEGWKGDCVKRIKDGVDEGMIEPDYGRPARITAPRK